MAALRRPFSRQYADFCEERNRQRSPLLRLPGELRNKVYEYVLSSVTVSVFPPSDAQYRYQLHAHISGPVAAPTADPTVSNAMALTRVCRQISVETVSLPLQLFTFYINSDESFPKFLNYLLPIQRDAIKTIQISTPDAMEGGSLFHWVQRRTDNDFPSQKLHLEYLEWSMNLALDHLEGLKQVVVEEDPQWLYLKANEHLLRDGIGSCIMGRDIDIVLPKPTG
ncbi:hypothetical protein HBI81_129930 [Parastagonospora nodorum]|nr:hypothetical protein HBI01_018900 [Parastagonospora nodorum]KAH4317100.1 hypothetical protein HBI02_035240 [Parastagonospora nodorum]KAH4326603.1 hypothetical protein HBI00_139150 [Parastagonospora nodorum]KAH4388456.1 hypothetical protein HBH94_035110 [Parastagonospora nodorum]KAH4476097.1 hypothetical protein HBH90_019480 [Parastagonospora nodorum]